MERSLIGADRLTEQSLFSVFLYRVIWVGSNEQGEAHMTEVPNPAVHLAMDGEFACSAYSFSYHLPLLYSF